MAYRETITSRFQKRLGFACHAKKKIKLEARENKKSILSPLQHAQNLAIMLLSQKIQ